MPSEKNGPRSRNMIAPAGNAMMPLTMPPSSAADHPVPMQIQHDDARGVGADPEKRDLAERKVAGVPGDDIEAVCQADEQHGLIEQIRASSR